MDCGIRFLTHPRNAGRRKLRCPFGCRRHHRQQRSKQRSAAYYQTPEGKRQKKLLNARRQRRPAAATAQQPQADPALPGASPNTPSGQVSAVTNQRRPEGVALDESSLTTSPMLPYVRMVVGLIEGVELDRREVVALLRQAMRQHRIGQRRGMDYVLGFLHQQPP
jgi:hypothetical protein